MEIKNSVFLVTGGASGLGAATAKTLAANGGKLVIADLNVALGEALAKEIGGTFVNCDVTSEADGQNAINTAVKTHGAIHEIGRASCRERVYSSV